MKRALLLLWLLSFSTVHAATEGGHKSPIRTVPISVLTGNLKPKTGTSRDTLMASVGDTNGTWVQLRPSDPVTIVYGTASDSTGTNNARAFRLFSSAVPSSRFTGGAFEVFAVCADSVEADSLATEMFLFGGAGSLTAGLVPVDSDDSNGAKFDGWMLTSLDSTSLSAPGNITPITGTASTSSKYPNHMSSRIVPSQHQRTAFGQPIPGSEGIEFGGLSGANPTSVICSWWIPVSDAFGGALSFRNLQVGLLNRHPRLGGRNVTWTIRYWPKAN